MSQRTMFRKKSLKETTIFVEPAVEKALEEKKVEVVVTQAPAETPSNAQQTV